MAEQLNVRRKPERFEPRVVTMTDDKGKTEKVYQVAPGRFQRKSDVENRIARLAESRDKAAAAKAEPPVDQLVEAFERRMDRHVALANETIAQLTDEVLPELEN